MKKILVIDDNVVMIRLLQVQVKAAGAEGFYFQDGASALEQFNSIQPDLIVLDYHLPDTNGVELYQKIRTLPAGDTVPIIFVTGTVNAEELEMIKALGVPALLSKPFSPRKIKKLITQLLAEA